MATEAEISGQIENIEIDDQLQDSLTTLTITYIDLWKNVYPDYLLTYAELGKPHPNEFLKFLTCTSRRQSTKPFFDNDGNMLCTIVATYKNEKPNYTNGVVTIRINSATDRIFKIYGGGQWQSLQLSGSKEQGILDYIVPSITVSLSTKIIGIDVDYEGLISKVKCLNNEPINIGGYTYGIGKVMLDGWTITDSINGEGKNENDITVNFKVSTLDWNYEYRQPEQARNFKDNSVLYWQSTNPASWNTYTTEPKKAGLPIWSGETTYIDEEGIQKTLGDPAVGTGGMDCRHFYIDGTDRTLYAYTDLNPVLTMLYGPPIPEEEG